MNELREIDEDIWIRDYPFYVKKIALGTRMTVVRLFDDQLWLNAPCGITRELKEELDGLGQVKFLVSPNRHHDFFLHKFHKIFPAAEVFVPTGSEKKATKSGIKNPIPMIPGGRYPWQPTIQTLAIQGMPGTNESVFFHHPSKTLICADLAFNFKEAPAGLMAKVVFGLAGTLSGFKVSRIFKFYIKDKEAYKESVEKLFELPIERVIVCHGEVLKGEGVKEIFKKALS